MRKILLEPSSPEPAKPARKPKSLWYKGVILSVALILAFFTWLVVSAALSPSPPHIKMVAIPPNAALPSKRLLFVGNSYTYSNQMPLMVQNLLNSTSEKTFSYHVDMLAKPAADLSQHIQEGVVVKRLRAAHYDMVFLQEQSTTPFYPERAAVSEANFAFLIKEAKATGARVIVLSTWPRRADNSFYWGRKSAKVDRPEDPAVMSRELNTFYQRVSQMNDVEQVPLSRYFYTIMKLHPEIALLKSDGSHPAVTGSYLAALSVYKHIMGSPDQTMWRPISVSAADMGVFTQMLAAE